MVFLCPCGDRPHEMKPLIALFTYYNESETYGLEVSPPARGWSHAIRCPPASIRFPRPRGDGPRYSGRLQAGHRVSPPARGWSLLDLGKIRVQLGFPARAGMVPSGPQRMR